MVSESNLGGVLRHFSSKKTLRKPIIMGISPDSSITLTWCVNVAVYILIGVEYVERGSLHYLSAGVEYLVRVGPVYHHPW